MEIERRWLMDGFPAVKPGELEELGELEKEQGYLCTAPVVRIRSEHAVFGKVKAEEYILCIKGKGTLARQEIETPLSLETFEQLKAFIGVPLVHKRTRLYRLPDGHELECSLVDEGEPTAFYYAEVEFETLEQARAFKAPSFLGEEKTEDASFSMSAYWKKKCAAYAQVQPAEKEN